MRSTIKLFDIIQLVEKNKGEYYEKTLPLQTLR